MRGTVKELLGEFWKKNKRLPEVLIVYRDGVSEGQFDEVCCPARTSMHLRCNYPVLPASEMSARLAEQC